jgi:hypothetical protein
MAKLKMLDPRASVNLKDRSLVPGLDTLEGKVIGIIDNGQANSTTMFQELAKLLQEKYRPAKVLLKTKPTHMQGAPKPIMEEFVSRCDAVITGLGAWGSCTSWSVHDAIELQKRGKPTVTLCQSIFMELGRTEAKFFGISILPLVEIPHHPSGGALPGEHRADAEGAVDKVNEKLTLGGSIDR